MPYLVENLEGQITLKFINLDQNQKGELELKNHRANRSIILIPSSQTSIVNTQSPLLYQFVLTFSAAPRTQEQEQVLIADLLERIAELQKQIAALRALIVGDTGTCGIFENNLYFGMRNNFEVTCLQEFLKSQGPSIYPEGIVSGNFFTLTQQAVIRFQEKYADDILAPLNLDKGTGYVGPSTRNIMNSI
ncbi:MAG TPA: peptidoglycan-binding protein [candidate division CPR3 bacterium]|uniref:Peptidoglycan-binding protein n=1 Tax=candidate division CPR3 bacterium TaxID=2268181 RepID=A0A7C1NSQ4_UNCC3|nr:peptidoglycan-binding protein [candidate division CPR3 bacterium]